MKLESFSALDEQVTKEDWERTPASVQRLLRWLFENYEERLADLEEDIALSKLEQEQVSETRTEKQAEVLEESKEVRCSFCGRKQREVSRIVSGPNVQICDECVEVCNAIVEDDAS